MKKIIFLIGFGVFTVNGANAQSRYSAPIQGNPRNTYISQHIGLPLKEMEAALRAKQEAYDASINECRNEVVTLYNSSETYPEIKDGKHSVTLTGSGMCQETYVIVDKGRVFSIPTDSGYITNFTLSTPIKAARSKIGIPDNTTGVTRYYDVIFLNDIFSK